MKYSPYSGRNIGFGIACREAYSSNKSSNKTNTMQRYIVRYTNIYNQAYSQFVEANSFDEAKNIALQDKEVAHIHEVVLSGRQ